MRDFHHAGRSTVHGANGAIATSQPLATMAGLDILKAGGNAIDAAIAASAVLCVVEPMMTGIGGDCFALIAKHGKLPVLGLNASGRSPAALTADKVRAQGHDIMPTHSVDAVTIPGALAGWDAMLAAHGTMSLGDVLQPAIQLAHDGYVVSPRVGMDWLFLAPLLQKNEAATKHFTCDGQAPAIGSIFKTPALGKTLEVIAAQGITAFYDGALTDEMVATLQGLGGSHTRDDFAVACADWVTPLASDYRGYTLYEIPPNGQGIAAQLILNILEGYKFDGIGAEDALRYHRAVEAQRFAMQARDTYVADQDYADVPVAGLLDKAYAARLRDQINDDTAMADIALTAPVSRSDTICLSVIDKDRTAVSFINSVYMGFGSGICTPDSGIMFQNRGAGFSLEPGHLNVLAGNKRPKHTIIPAMLTRDGRPLAAYGVMGGDYQAMGHAHFAQNLIDFDLDLQEAVDCPRVFWNQGVIETENSVADAARQGLESRGHKLGPAMLPHGGAQAVQIDWDHGTLCAASDPRKDGLALAY